MRAAGETDYRNLKKDGVRPQDDRMADSSRRRWWDAKESDVAQSIVGNVQFLERAQAGRMRQHRISARLYGNLALLGATSGQTGAIPAPSASRDRITYNAIMSIIDTLTSRVGETKPRPYYLTSGGSYSQQRKAKKLNQFTEGVFYETQTYDKGLDCFRDSAIWGDGLMHVYGRGGKLHHERMLSTEFWVDEVEAMYGYPRTGYRVKDVDRDELAAMWSDDKKAVKTIEDASRVSDTDGGRGESVSDMIRIVESWRLAAMDDKGDLSGGKHVFAVCGAKGGTGLLGEVEDWEFDFFPFARLPWCKRPVGYWSQGLCEQLQGQQLGVNRKLYYIDRAMQLAGTVKVAVRNGSRVSKEHISNDIGGILEYTGEPPQFFTAQPVHQQLFDSVNIDIARMYQQSGANEMSTGGKKPAGLNSGKALREYEDIESERHRTTSRLNDNFYLQIAALDAAFAGELRGYSVKVPGRNAFSRINFKDDIGSLKDEDFIRQCFPVSRLPRDPAGRLQTIQEYMAAGFMTPRQGRRALDFPDLEAIESLANAQEDMLTKVFDDMLDDGKYRPPEPTDDLALGLEMVLENIQRYRQFDDAEYEKLDMLRRWMSQAKTLMARAMAPPPNLTALPGGMAGAPPGGAVQGVPPKAPTSDLLPQAA